MVTRTKYIFKKNWVQPEQVTAIVKKYLQTPSLNICCGSSMLGDLRADIYLDVKPDILCDVFKPPFKPGSFKTVYSDPPWNLPYPKRIKLSKALSLLVEAGGYLIVNAPWVTQMKGMKLMEIYLCYSHYVHQNVSCITILQRMNNYITH